MARLTHLLWLGTKELHSLKRDTLLILLILFSFSIAVYTQATGSTTGVNNASIAFVDEDHSGLSAALVKAFYPPQFQMPRRIPAEAMDQAMDLGEFMIVVVIPPRFEARVRAGRSAEIQINIDATVNTQAGIANSNVQRIIGMEISHYLTGRNEALRDPVTLVPRTAFNPNHDRVWFNAIVALINQITVTAVILTGAALIREREHGTIEHLLVMPLSPFEIALAKIWANGLVILVAVSLSLALVVHGLLAVPLAGSAALFMAGTLVYLFFATALGVFLGTIVRSMAQFALLVLLALVALQMLSGGQTPVESQPPWLQHISLFLPSRHFISFSQDILFRGAGLAIVWPRFLAVAGQGAAFFGASLWLFRRSIARREP